MTQLVERDLPAAFVTLRSNYLAFSTTSDRWRNPYVILLRYYNYNFIIFPPPPPRVITSNSTVNISVYS